MDQKVADDNEVVRFLLLMRHVVKNAPVDQELIDHVMTVIRENKYGRSE